MNDDHTEPIGPFGREPGASEIPPPIGALEALENVVHDAREAAIRRTLRPPTRFGQPRIDVVPHIEPFHDALKAQLDCSMGPRPRVSIFDRSPWVPIATGVLLVLALALIVAGVASVIWAVAFA